MTVEVRTAIELPYQDTAEVITRIFEITKKPHFSSFVEKHGGLDGLINEVAPNVISSILAISKPIKQSLLEAGFDTVAKIEGTSDANLLKLIGIGNKGLVKLRNYCEVFQGNRYAIRQVIS